MQRKFQAQNTWQLSSFLKDTILWRMNVWDFGGMSWTSYSTMKTLTTVLLGLNNVYKEYEMNGKDFDAVSTLSRHLKIYKITPFRFALSEGLFKNENQLLHSYSNSI